ncbi:MAG: HAD-IA family hydrolase [Hyphomicrobiaceae bacterium]|nr:HAD-IA family hydrolase [Hyphomicrobiaceae bacterium]
MLKALIFDVDGTLSETEETHRSAFNQAFDELELGWNWDQPLYGKLLDVTGGKERIRHYLEAYSPRRIPEIPASEPQLADWIAALHARKTTIYNAMIDTGAAGLRPGVEALLRHAHNAGIRLAIATTTSLPNVESLIRSTLGMHGLELFETIAAGDMVKAKKPAPDVYLLALDRLGLRPEQCLALEDSVNGLKSAQAAQLPVVVTTSVYTVHQQFPGAATTVPDFAAMAGSAADTPVAGQAILASLKSLHAENASF